MIVSEITKDIAYRIIYSNGALNKKLILYQPGIEFCLDHIFKETKSLHPSLFEAKLFESIIMNKSDSSAIPDSLIELLIENFTAHSIDMCFEIGSIISIDNGIIRSSHTKSTLHKYSTIFEYFSFAKDIEFFADAIFKYKDGLFYLRNTDVAVLNLALILKLEDNTSKFA